MFTKLLAFLRSCLFYVGYGPGSFLMSLVFLVIFPLLSPRARYRFSSAWCAFVLGWLRITCGVRHRVRGLENLPQTASVILANHQSTWETLYFFQLVYPVAPILKKELLAIPVWGKCLALLHPIAIDRSRPRDAGKSLLTQGVSRLKEGYWVMVFPEGTRTGPGEVKRFSRGGAKLARAAGVPIVPAAVDTGKCWPPRRFLKFPGTVNIEFGKPLSTQDKDANLLAEEVEHWVRECLAALESRYRDYPRQERSPR